MKFEIGDKVALLHSGETGTIMEQINEEMVMVEVAGIQFPVYADQLDYPYFKSFSGDKSVFKKTGRPRGEDIPPERKAGQPGAETGVWLSFLPVYAEESGEETVHELKIFLINETGRLYKLHYHLYTMQSLFLEVKNELAPFSHFYLNDLLFEALNDNPRFEFLFSLKEPDKKAAETFTKVLKLKPKQVFQKMGELRDRRDASFRFLLFERYPDRAIPETPDFSMGAISNPVKISNIPPNLPDIYEPKYEIDLHIDQLMDNWRGLSNFEILTIQLHEFQRYLDLAIAHKQFSMVVIHGVGKGKLRDEIHQILQHTPEVRNFVNQYDIRYGYGATEIFFTPGP